MRFGHKAVRCRGRRGTAALEFALIAPVLAAMIGSVADVGLAFWFKSILADAVAQGAQYAALVGSQNLSGTTVQGNIKAIVQTALPTASVSVSAPSCGCPNVLLNPPSLIAMACGLPCASAASTSSTYVTITTSYTYVPIVPGLSGLVGKTMNDAAVVRMP